MFVPRSVTHKTPRPLTKKVIKEVKPQEPPPLHATTNTEDQATRASSLTVDATGPLEEEEEEEVVVHSTDQRWPLLGEPVCVVCGRYGAYIIDLTDEDICSLECKRVHLKALSLDDAKEKTGDERDVSSDDGGGVCRGPPVASTDGEEVGGVYREHPMAGGVYREHPTIASMTPAQVELLRQQV